ncbi:maternal embryonic leucine zipper kinase-like isoform X2 [Falco peregrinus]|uniref:maternal embryonic leucine zipper kinase-like isoform X2 n=1 Tax=Falco peregrinus TaxID=8954 RepID=UPI002478A331|nr:maternal embryonic leucine zipper kinase-like isoform X2 [Falco peregrinus]XP_055646160.1 maternal embryonic leucine zipper kinase-like isoform X2 [Falco peregrinus]XP_055646161.1 maternal embryonic leucine zipper kinase-like isoform X2 [Falco peregrinus]
MRKFSRTMNYVKQLEQENLLVGEEHNLKLVDFGLHVKPKGGLEYLLNTCCGSPVYAAPELIRGKAFVSSEIAQITSCVAVCGCCPLFCH